MDTTNPLQPLHTWTKSHDHESVRVQKKCSKAVPTNFQNHAVSLRALKCSVKSYVTCPSTKCYFNKFLFMWGSYAHNKPLVLRFWSSMVSWFWIRATSHARLKAHDHNCNLIALIGWKGGDYSLHRRRWRSKGPKNTYWMKSLHGVLHGGLWIRFHGSPGICIRPTSKRWAKRKFRETIIFLSILFQQDKFQDRLQSILQAKIQW